MKPRNMNSVANDENTDHLILPVLSGSQYSASWRKLSPLTSPMDARALCILLHTAVPAAKTGRGPQAPYIAYNVPSCVRSPQQSTIQLSAPVVPGPPLFHAAEWADSSEAAGLPPSARRVTHDDPFPVAVGSSAGHLNSARRALLMWLASVVTMPAFPLPAPARGLFQMPPVRLSNRYFLVRAGESEYERLGLVNTNPVAKTSVDSGLSEEGKLQAVRSARELRRMGACENSCWIWPSITQRSYQAAEIIAALNGVDRSHIVPEYSFLDARGLGAYEGKNLDSISEVYASDSVSPDIKPPPINDGTPNESVSDVFVRVTQLMSIVETQYSADTVIIVSPDSDNLSVLQAGLTGLDLRRHRELFFGPGEVRFVDPDSIPPYKQPASSVYTCANPPSCR